MIDLPRTPIQVKAYVDVLGHDGAIEFLLRFGGADIYLSRNPTSRSQVVEAIGREQAIALAAHPELQDGPVPLAKPWIAKVWYAQGLSKSEIARKMHVSRVTARRFLAAEEPAPAPKAQSDNPAGPVQLRLPL